MYAKNCYLCALLLNTITFSGCGLQDPARIGNPLPETAPTESASDPLVQLQEDFPIMTQTTPLMTGSGGALAGTWVLEQGDLIPEFDVFLDVNAITFNNDGTGRIYFHDIVTQANDCARIYNLFDGETLIIDFTREPTMLFAPVKTVTIPNVVVHNSMLGLADEGGRIAIFSRQSAVPAEFDCRPLTVTERFESLPSAQFFSDLVLNDGDLFYSINNAEVQPFDLDSGALLPPLQSGVSGDLIQTTQDGDFWGHCGCGGSRDIFRTDLTTVIDTVETESELFNRITVRAAAYVPTMDRLWLHGPDINGNEKFLVVNTNGEPDIGEAEIFFTRRMDGLAFDGTDLWGIIKAVGTVVARIDVNTGRVIETFAAPDGDHDWRGIVFDDFNMYMLGEAADTSAVIIKSPRGTLSSPNGNGAGTVENLTDTGL